jgi:hypothetical protein
MLAIVAMTVLFTDRADALTCAYEPLSLEESYALAEGIVVARVLGCADGATPENGRCADYRYHLETIEVLKQPEPWQNISGAYQGADGMTRCGQAFTSGESYLLFFDRSGSIISSAGGALKGPYPQTRETQWKLAILREYRDGRVADLADPWIFSDVGLSCELKQRVAGHEISFVYPYTEPSGEYAYGVEFDDDGNPTLANPTPVSRGFSQGMAREIEGPQFEPNSLSFSVRFLDYLETERDTGTISVGDGAWDLETQILTMYRDGRELFSLSSDLALGESAQQIFDAMLAPAHVTIRKRGQAQPAAGVTRTPTPVTGPEDVVVETRTTQFAGDAKKFQQCIDGTRRAPRPAGR